MLTFNRIKDIFTATEWRYISTSCYSIHDIPQRWLDNDVPKSVCHEIYLKIHEIICNGDYKIVHDAFPVLNNSERRHVLKYSAFPINKYLQTCTLSKAEEKLVNFVTPKKYLE